MNSYKQLYIDLLKNVLTDFFRINTPIYHPAEKRRLTGILNLFIEFINSIFKTKYSISTKIEYSIKDRESGLDWPLYAETMIGIKRMENIEYCVNAVIKENIEGDFIETGVWRGGAVIFMKALLKVNNYDSIKLWVADSFEGLPMPNSEKYIHDKYDLHYTYDELKISENVVRENFRKFNLLDANVIFLKGWFKDTLPIAPIEKLALIRLDGDMYESTMDGLVNLYPKLSIGGYIIIDDWGAVESCKKAVIDYRKKFEINEEILTIDWTGVYWKKTK